MQSLVTSRWFRPLFYTCWFILLVVQAAFTQLMDDEAYYWVYAQNLHIGYYDHPPMIALFIRCGYVLFKNELGVRLLSVIASMVSLWCIEYLLPHKNFPLFAVLVSSVLITQVGGFIAVPDSPYVFFVALFFVQYKRFIHSSGWLHSVLLGICAAGILYSKYHGAMLLFFVVLAWLPVLKRPGIYLAGLVALLLYAPHVWWLWQNNFPSFQYHFGDRNVPSYTPMFTVNYLLGQLVIFGPFTSVFVFIALVKGKTADTFERVLRWSSVGVLAFLFLFAFKGTIEANWTLCLSLPLIYLVHQWLYNRTGWKKWFYYTAPVSIGVLLLLRVFLMYDFTHGWVKLPVNFHAQKKWTEGIHERAGHLPVVFINSYQRAAVYSFYTGEKAISLNNIMYRMNEYNLLGIEDSLQGKEVYVVPNWPAPVADTFLMDHKTWYEARIERFSSFSKIHLENTQEYWTVKPGESFHFPVNVGTQYTQRVVFAPDASYPSYYTYHFFKQRNMVMAGNTQIEVIPSHVGTVVTLPLVAPLEPGAYDLRISISTGWLPPSINSRKWKITVQ